MGGGSAVMTITGIVVLFIGFTLIISYPINRKKNARCTQQTQGVLEEVRRRYNSKGSLKSMHVYSYQVAGVDYQLATLDYSPEAKRPGDQCTIWYNPAKPQDAQAYRASDKYLKLLLVIGIALLVVGIVIIFVGLIR